MRTQDANQLRLLGRGWWLGNHRAKQGRPDIHSATSPEVSSRRWASPDAVIWAQEGRTTQVVIASDW